jgi:hypothetical protein
MGAMAGLRVGMRHVEVKVRRVDGRWIAAEVERSRGGGEHGGRNPLRRGARRQRGSAAATG